MYTVRLGDQDLPINDLSALAAKAQLGQIPPDAPVFDHVNAAWTTAAVLLRAMGAQSTLPLAAPPVPGPPGPPAAATAPGVPWMPFEKHTPSVAVASVILSLLGFCTCFFLSIIGIVLGYNARAMIDANPNLHSGRDVANAGIIIGWIVVGIYALVFLAVAAIVIAAAAIQ